MDSHLSVKTFCQWLCIAAVQAALIFFGCFSSLNYSPESLEISSHGLDHIDSGKQPDLTLIGSLLLGTIVVSSNIKVLCDSHETNIATVAAFLFSIGSFLAIVQLTSANSESDLFSTL